MSSASESSCVISRVVPRSRTQPFCRGTAEQIQDEYEPLLHAPKRQQAGRVTTQAVRDCHFAPNSHRPNILADVERFNRIRCRFEEHPAKNHDRHRDVIRTPGTAVVTGRSISHEAGGLPLICSRRLPPVSCLCQRSLRISPVRKTNGCHEAVPQQFFRELTQKLSSLSSGGNERSSTTDETSVPECLTATGSRQLPQSDDEESSNVELTTPTSPSVRNHALAVEKLLSTATVARKPSTDLEPPCTQCEQPTILKARRLDDIFLGANAGTAREATRRSSPDVELRGWDEDDILSKLFIQIL